MTRKLLLLITPLLLVAVPLAQASRCQFQAAGTGQSGTGAVSPAWPTHVSGDVALLFVESANETITLSTPAGFAEVANSPQGTGTGGSSGATRLAVFWARATSGSMGAPTVADPGDHAYARILTFRGCAASGNPVDTSAGTVKAVASVTDTFPAVTTTVADTTIVLAATRDNDSAAAAFSAWTNTNFVSIMERSDAGTTSGNGGGLAVGVADWKTTGSTGTSTATVTSSVAGLMTIALKPEVPTACTDPKCPADAKNSFDFITPNWGAVSAEHGDLFHHTYQNVVGTGNLKWCYVSYTAASLAISDNVDGSWGAAAASVAPGAYGVTTAIYRKIAGNSSGALTTVTFDLANPGQLHARCGEEYNVTATVDASASRAEYAASGCSPNCLAVYADSTALTATQTNDFIVYGETDVRGPIGDSGILVGEVTRILPDPGWTMGYANPTDSFSVQTMSWGGSGAINPSMAILLATGDDENQHNVLAVAFQWAGAGGAGTAPPATGMRITNLSRFQITDKNPEPYAVSVGCPSANLLIFTSERHYTQDQVTAISDSVNGAWTKLSDSGQLPQALYRDAATGSSDLYVKITHATGQSPGGEQALWCVQNAKASSAFGHEASGWCITNGTDQPGCSYSPVGGGAVAHAPDITPEAADTLVIALMNTPTGPQTAVAAPMIFANTPYDMGETDLGATNSGDGSAYTIATSTSPISVTWTMSQGNQAWNSRALTFLGVPAAPSGARKRVIVIQ